MLKPENMLLKPGSLYKPIRHRTAIDRIPPTDKVVSEGIEHIPGCDGKVRFGGKVCHACLMKYGKGE